MKHKLFNKFKTNLLLSVGDSAVFGQLITINLSAKSAARLSSIHTRWKNRGLG